MIDPEKLHTVGQETMRPKLNLQLDPAIYNSPVYKRREDINRTVDTNTYTLLISPPGTGKSTTLPALLLEHDPNAHIIELQPRRTAVDNVANWASKLVKDEVGGLIGKRYKRTNIDTGKTRFIVEVPASLTNELSKPGHETLPGVKRVIADEVHEPDPIALALLKRANKLRKEKGIEPLKVIATSGTLDAKGYQKYFDGAPIIEIEPPKPKEIDIKFSTVDYSDVDQLPAQAARVLADQILKPALPGDVLIVTPGRSEMEDTKAAIESIIRDRAKEGLKNDDLEIMFYDRSTPKDIADQEILHVKKEHENKRRIIIATSIANTSVTIPRLYNLINMGWQKLPNIDPDTNLIVHDPVRTSRSTIKQIQNRVSREEDAPLGHVFHLFSEESFNKRPEYDTSEIQRTDLAAILLRLKSMNLDIKDLDLIESPTDAQVAHAAKSLRLIQALDTEGNITKTEKGGAGQEMATYELEPHLAHMMVEAKRQGITNAGAVLAAMYQNHRELIYGSRKEADAKHTKYKDKQSDFYSLINIWNDYIANKNNDQWFKDMQFNKDTFTNIELDIKDIAGIDQPVAINFDNDTRKKLKRSIMEGFADRILEQFRGYDYRWLSPPAYIGDVTLSKRSVLRTTDRNAIPVYSKYVIAGEIGKSQRFNAVANWNMDLSDKEDLEFINEVRNRIAEVEGKAIPQETPPESIEKPKDPPPAVITPTPSIEDDKLSQAIQEETRKIEEKPRESVAQKIYKSVRKFFHNINPITIMGKI